MFRFAAALLGLAFSSSVFALATAYTDYPTFVSVLPGAATTLDFESATAGTLITSGSSIGGITFTYNFGPVSMAVTDGAQFGGGGPFDTTSGSNFLGTDDGDLFQDGDNFSMSFSAVNALGMFFITADEMLDDDITLAAGGVTASLVVADLYDTLNDGSFVYFLGIIDPAATFASASVATSAADGGPYFLYNVDDIVTANTEASVPLPSTLVLMLGALVGIPFTRRATLPAA